MVFLENQMDAIIMTAFPQYKQEEIESWTLDRTAKIFAMAEWALSVIRGVGIEIDLSESGQGQSLPLPPSPNDMFGIS
jgi:hypothetical protein